jgi:O-antigen ligase
VKGTNYPPPFTLHPPPSTLRSCPTHKHRDHSEAPEQPAADTGRTGPVLLRRLLLILVTTLLVARPLVLGEDPGLTDPLSDPASMVLTLLWLVAAGGWAVWRLWSSRQGGSDRALASNCYAGPVEWALLAAVGLVFVSISAASYKHPAWLVAWEWVGLLAGLFVVRQLAVSEEDQRGLFAVLLAGAVSLSAHAVYQYQVELPRTRAEVGSPDSVREFLARHGQYRDPDDPVLQALLSRARTENVFGPYSHPNSFADYLVLWLPGLVGALFVCRRSGAPLWRTVLVGACLALGATALWLTHSRGAILAALLVGTVATVLAIRGRLRTHPLQALTALAALAAGLVAVYHSGLLAGGQGGKESGAGSLALRLEYWRGTWRMIAAHPWLGVGPGNFGENYLRYMDPSAVEVVREPHNFALEVWATSGIFALVAVLAALLAFLWRVVLSVSKRPSGSREEPASEPAAASTPAGGRWEFYLGGVFGLLLGFILRAGDLTPGEIVSEAIASGLRSVVWFAALGLLERLDWSARGRALALLAGIVALLLNLGVSGGIAFSSVAGPLWVAIALGLNACGPVAAPRLSRAGMALIVPVPVLIGVALFYLVAILYPVAEADSLTRRSLQASSAFLQATSGKTPEDRKLIRDPRKFLTGRVLAPLRQAAEVDPDNAHIRALLANWYGQLWRFESYDERIGKVALQNAVAAQQLDPRGREGYQSEYQLHMIFAGDSYQSGRSLRDKDPERADFQFAQSRRQAREAAEALGRYVPNDPYNPSLHYLLANARFEADEEEKGKQEAEEALRLNEKIPARSTRKLTSGQLEQVRKWLGLAPVTEERGHP